MAPLPDRDDCLERLRDARFGDTVTCVYCGSESIETTGTTSKGAQQYRCRTCKGQFNDVTHTVFASRAFSVSEMFYIIKEMDDKPVAEIQRDLDRHQYEPVLDFVHHVRAIHPDRSELPLRELCGDETLY